MSLTLGLHEKVAVITGGSGILGKSMARTLCDAGCKVVILGRSESKLEAARKELPADSVMAFSCDLLDANALNITAEKILSKWNRMDILVNAAGGNNPKATTAIETMQSTTEMEKSFFELSIPAVKEVLDSNFTSAVMATQIFGRSMATQKSGTIINISSMSAMTALTKVPAYSAAKAALTNWTQWLAVHLAPMGVRVNAIAPGFFLTEQNRTLLQNSDGSPTARGNKILTHTPMNRLGQSSDLSGALLWLANEQLSGFVTGTVIPIDGGFSAYAGV